MDHPEFLRRAVDLAAGNAAAGQLPFGALVVRDGEVLAIGVNTALRDLDPTAHADVAAVRNACRNLGALHLTGAFIYSSCEPCALCHTAALSVGIVRIVYAARKEDIPDLHYPAPPDRTGLVERIRTLVAGAAPRTLLHVPVDDATRPFERWGREH